MDKKIYLLDAAVVTGSLIVLIAFIGYVQPQIIAPLDDEVAYNNSVLFSFANADVIYIDDNLEFSSPEEIYVKDNIIVNLEPGTYYWKIKGVRESEIRQLTIVSKVDLRLKEGNGVYEVVNAGNILLDVEVYDKGKWVKNLTLGAQEGGSALGEEVKFVGREKNE